MVEYRQEVLKEKMFKTKTSMEASLSMIDPIGDGSNVQIARNCSEKIKWPVMEAVAA